jgi:hypothetical protein
VKSRRLEGEKVSPDGNIEHLADGVAAYQLGEDSGWSPFAAVPATRSRLWPP